MRTGFSLCSISNREKPVFINWEPCNENRIFPVWKYYTGKTLFWPCTGPVRDCSVFMAKYEARVWSSPWPCLSPFGSEGPVMYSSKYIVGLTKAGFQDCYEIPIIMISLSLCTAQGLKEMNNQRYTASALQSFLGPAKKGQS